MYPTSRLDRLQLTLAQLAGADPKALCRAPTELTKYAAIGLTLLLSAGLASIGMALALTYVDLSLPTRLLAGAAWGVAFWNLDRLLIVALHPLGIADRTIGRVTLWLAANVLPRVTLAVLLGFALGVPLELRLFSAEVAEELSRARATRTTSDDAEVATRHQPEQVRLQTQEQQTRANLLAQDRSVAKLTAQRDQYLRRYADEMSGVRGQGHTGRRGPGPIARRYLDAKDDADQALVRQRAATARLRDELAAIQVRQAALEDRIAETRGRLRRAVEQPAGLLERIEALYSLPSRRPLMAGAIIVLQAILLLLELVPLLTKVGSALRGGGPYEAELAALAAEEAEASVRSVAYLAHRHALRELYLTATAERHRLEVTARLDRLRSVLRAKQLKAEEVAAQRVDLRAAAAEAAHAEVTRLWLEQVRRDAAANPNLYVVNRKFTGKLDPC